MSCDGARDDPLDAAQVARDLDFLVAEAGEALGEPRRLAVAELDGEVARRGAGRTARVGREALEDRAAVVLGVDRERRGS